MSAHRKRAAAWHLRNQPTERMAPVMPAWKVTRRHYILLTLVLAALVIVAVEPIRNLFLLGGLLGLSLTAEGLALLGGAVVWVVDNLVAPVTDQVIAWF